MVDTVYSLKVTFLYFIVNLFLSSLFLRYISFFDTFINFSSVFEKTFELLLKGELVVLLAILLPIKLSVSSAVNHNSTVTFSLLFF